MRSRWQGLGSVGGLQQLLLLMEVWVRCSVGALRKCLVHILWGCRGSHTRCLLRRILGHVGNKGGGDREVGMSGQWQKGWHGEVCGVVRSRWFSVWALVGKGICSVQCVHTRAGSVHSRVR